jgi:hypothetical protein
LRYYVVQGNDELGPFDENELRELSIHGHLLPTTHIHSEDGAKSGVLSDILPLIASDMTNMKQVTSVPSPAASSWVETGKPMYESSRPAEVPFSSQNNYTLRQQFEAESKFDERNDRGSTELKISKWTIIGSVAIAAAGLFFFAMRGKWTFFDGVNLIFHEAGHLILGFMPEFIVALGGTLLQLIIPGLLAFYFHRHEKMFAAQFCVMWLGQSLLNVSNYIADARARVLPLVGGGEHDWTYLLGKMGLLQHDVAIGKFLNVIALLIFVAAAAWPWLCQWWNNRKAHQASA